MKKDIEYEIKSLDPSKIHLVEIIAHTAGEFGSTVDHLKKLLKDNGVRNNIIYVHRRIDIETGKPAESNIRIETND